MLTGKYARDLTGPKGTRHGEKPDPKNEWRERFVNERNLEIADAVKAVAAELGTTPTAVAIAWTLWPTTVSSVIIGPKSLKQLEENLAGCEVRLSYDQWQRLDAASPPHQPYPEWFVARNPRNAGEGQD